MSKKVFFFDIKYKVESVGPAAVAQLVLHWIADPEIKGSNPLETSSLYYKSFMVVIYDRNDSTIIIYDHVTVACIIKLLS